MLNLSMRILLTLTLSLILMTSAVAGDKYYSCPELLKSVAYPTQEDARKMRMKLMIADGGMTVVQQTSRVVVSGILGVTGLPLSISFSLLFKALKMAGIELGKNHRQMIAVVLVSEELINNKIDINGHFGKADLLIFENFLSAKREFIRYIRKQEKKAGIPEEERTELITNIAFAKLVVSLENFVGTLEYEDGTSEEVNGESFYCKTKKSGRVKFKGFNRKANAMLYKAFISTNL